jgi:hypothetical protein
MLRQKHLATKFSLGCIPVKIHPDESIPEDLYTLWLEFQNKLDHLNNIKVPRHITSNEPHNIELHGFSNGTRPAIFFLFNITSDYYIRDLCCLLIFVPFKVVLFYHYLTGRLILFYLIIV